MLILQGAKHKGPTLETMNVVISPNLKKTSDKIDNHGNIRHRDGSEEPIDPQYIPTPEEIQSSLKKVAPASSPQEALKAPEKPESPLAGLIKAQVNQAVQEAIKNIDISKMVSEAVNEAFK